MKVLRSDLNDVFVALGYPNCPKWSDELMVQNVNGKLPSAMVTQRKLLSADEYAFVKTVVSAKVKGDKITIKGEDSDAGPKAKPNKTSSKKETPPVKTKTKKSSKNKAAVEKKVKTKSGPGVIDTLVDYLKEHSKNNPLTVDAAAKHLKKKYFKDKGIEQLTNTIRQQLSSQLKREPRELDVRRADGGGYYIKKGK